MSAADELRRMLDERGVAHSDHYLSTTWRDRYGIPHLAGAPTADGLLVVDMLTPDQAIAATLGGNGKSRWHELFGTPERAAQTMAMQCFGAPSEACDTCVFGECDGKLRNSGTYQTVYDALLEWLRGDAE